MPSRAVVPTWDYQDETKEFVARGIWGGRERFAPESVAIGFANECEGLIAGFVFHDWHPAAGTIEVSAYSARRNWLTREHMLIMAEYAFETVGVRLVLSRHSERNHRVRRIWQALGADQYVIPELRGPGEAEVLATFSRAAWQRFMQKGAHHGRRFPPQAA